MDDVMKLSIEGDFETWGRIIKTLATGIDHMEPIGATWHVEVDPGPPPAVARPPIDPAKHPEIWAVRQIIVKRQSEQSGGRPALTPPVSRAQLVDIVDRYVPGAVIPDRFQWVEFAQDHNDVLSIRMPSAVSIVKKTAGIIGGAQPGDTSPASAVYSLPGFLTDWATKITAGTVVSRKDGMKVHDQRVGDYSIAHCM